MPNKYSKLILSLLSLLIFLALLFAIAGGTPRIDSSVSSWAVNFQNSATNGFFIFLGGYSQSIMIGIVIAMSIFLYLRKRRKQSLIFVLTLTAGYVFEKSIKLIVQRVRPEMQLVKETGFSFPSGHAVLAVILFSTLIYFYKDEIKNKTAKYFFVAVNVFLIFLVGFSRIYLNVHWFTDVVAGYVFGFFLTCLGIISLKKFRSKF